MVIVGHGGFTIENVRTCVERKCKKARPVDRGLPEIDMDDEAWKTSGSFTNSVQTASMFMNSGLSFTIFWGRWKTFL